MPAVTLDQCFISWCSPELCPCYNTCPEWPCQSYLSTGNGIQASHMTYTGDTMKYTLQLMSQNLQDESQGLVMYIGIVIFQKGVLSRCIGGLWKCAAACTVCSGTPDMVEPCYNVTWMQPLLQVCSWEVLFQCQGVRTCSMKLGHQSVI